MQAELLSTESLREVSVGVYVLNVVVLFQTINELLYLSSSLIVIYIRTQKRGIGYVGNEIRNGTGTAL